MAATQSDIRRWLNAGRVMGATHMIVVCNLITTKDRPVYVRPGEGARAIFSRHDGQNMQKVMEVYCLSLDIESQLAEHRAFHF